MEPAVVRSIWNGVTIGGLVLTFLGAGIGLLGYIQTGKINRRIAAIAPYEAPITSASAAVRVVIASDDNVNSMCANSGGFFVIKHGSTSLLTATGTSCLVRQLGGGRVQYSGDFTVSPDDACMGNTVRDLGKATAANIKLNPMGAQRVLGGSVTLVINGNLRFDIPIAEQTTETGIVIVTGVSGIMRSQIPLQ